MSKEIEINFINGSPLPKYRQIADSISESVREGILVKGDKIPSLNELCKKHGLSQDTVLMAYNELKSRGIITASIGKGYFIANTQVNFDHKVFLLFDKLTAYKETLYEALKETLKGKGNEQIFLSL
ncbi:MAG: winged helix-turn-helix transcriptional regulator [Bacteroidetes bacterium]|nr:winged helix-turn-helix transcriptional regulator [Bacteroidota bacterium]